MRLGHVVRSLQAVLPGVTGPWEDEVHPDWLQLRLAAVLVLLFPLGEDTSFVLTRRPEGLRSHPGQISLPGGRVEPSDRSPWDAALRETWEEIGIPAADVHPIGRLRPLQVAASKNLVLPFVGWTASSPPLHPPNAEVEERIDVPVTTLLDPRTVAEELWILRDSRHYLVTYYHIGGHAVWGLTARILSDLSSRLGAQAAPFPPGSVRQTPRE
jgi:8-oxo-dGTP pyrophosphatase MutT (NUDIX family)